MWLTYFFSEYTKVKESKCMSICITSVPILDISWKHKMYLSTKLQSTGDLQDERITTWWVLQILASSFTNHLY